MSRTHDFYMTQRIIDYLMKAAAVVLTSSATLAVADEAFASLEGPWRWAIKIGALTLVEGAFIASWLAIDTQRDAPMASKVAWSITLVVIYVALLLLAIAHGEGMAGWAFRFVLAVMIGRSIYEAGVYELLKSAKKADRDIRSTFTYRRLKRLQMREDAIRSLNVESKQSNYARQMGANVNRAKLEAEHEAAMVEVALLRQRLVDQVHLKDAVLQKTAQQLPPMDPQTEASARREQLQARLIKRLTENPNRSIKTLSLLTKMSEEEVVAHLIALEEAGVLQAAPRKRSGYALT